MRGIDNRTMRRLCGLGVLSALIACHASLPGAGKPRRLLAERPARQGPSDSKEVQAFCDGFFPGAMARWHIPGAAFVLVKDGKVLLARGYGYADLERKIPVDARRTVFRVASVSKVFTATAVMQLAEQGKLNLNADVNTYLKSFKVKETYPQPVTLAELLTHTAGFDASVFGIAARSPQGVAPLGQFLARHMPARVMPPGKIYSYSSYGIALAGYIVQKVSGQPFDAYVAKNILQPLDMRHSNFRLTPQLAAHLATGYDDRKGRYVREPIDDFNIVPAVGLYSTAADIGHFAIAQLDDGRYGGARLLEAATAHEMHRRQFTEDPRLAGRTFGFYERFFNGRRVIAHGGNIRGFASLLMLIPRERTGFFVVFNRDESRFEDDLIQSFFDHYYPDASGGKPPQARGAPARDLARLTGSYRSNPFSRHTFEKLITLYWQYRITANRDGSLEFHYPHHFKPASRWVERAPLYFVCKGAQGHAVFETDARGRVTYLFTDRDSYEKIPWYGAAAFQVGLVKALMLVLLSGLVFWPILWVVRRWRKRPVKSSGELRWGRWIAAAAAALNVFFIVELLHIFSAMDDWDFVYGVPSAIKALLCIPLLTTALAAGMVYFALRAWMRSEGSVAGRVHYSLVALAALAFVAFFAYWNLLGFRY